MKLTNSASGSSMFSSTRSILEFLESSNGKLNVNERVSWGVVGIREVCLFLRPSAPPTTLSVYSSLTLISIIASF